MAKNGKTRWIGRYLKYVLLLFAGLLVLVGVGIVPLNLFFAKDLINEAVRTNLGAELDIRGPLILKLGFNSNLSAADILLYTPGGGDQPLVTVNHLSIQPVLVKIFRGDIHLRSLTASDVTIDYCPENFPERGTGPAAGEVPSFTVQALNLEQIQLHCDRSEEKLSIVPDTLDLEASAGLGQPLKLKISGQQAGEAMELNATLGSLDSLLSDPSDFPLKAQMSAFNSVLDLEGSIHRPLSEPGLAARIDFESKDLAVLLEKAGLNAPPLEPLQFEADATVSLDELKLQAATGNLGEIKFSLDGLVRGFSERFYIELRAQVSQLDLDKLPVDEQAETSTDNWRDLSFQPWLDELRQFDARVHVAIDKVLGAPLAMEDLAISAGLDQGKLSVDRAEMKLANSPLSARARLDLHAQCPELVTDLQLSDVDLAVVNRFLENDGFIRGRVEQARMESSSCGVTLGEHIDSLHLVSSFQDADPAFQDVDVPLMIDTLAIEFSSHEPGRLEFNGLLLEERLAAGISFGSITELLAESHWPLKIRANGASSELILDGSAALISGAPSLNARLKLDVARFGGLHSWIGSEPDNQLAGMAATQISLDESGWSLADIDVQLGKSSLRGELSRVFNENSPLLNAKLNFDLLELNELAGLFPDPADDSPQAAPPAEHRTISDDEWIDRWFSVPAIDFELSARQIAGIDFDLTSVSANGRIGNRLIEDSHLSLEFEDVEIAGGVDADFRQRPWKLAYRVDVDNLDIGHLLSRFDLTDDVAIKAKHLDFSIYSEGESIRELLAQSSLEAHMEELIWAGGQDSTNELVLTQVEVTSFPSSAANWSANGTINAVPIRIWMHAPSIFQILESPNRIPLRLALGAGNDLAMIDTVIDLHSDDLLRAEFTVSGQRMDSDTVRLSELKPPLDDYELSSQLTLKQDSLHLTGLEAKLGSSQFTGQINVETREEPYHIDARLESPNIETDDFVSLFAQLRSAGQQDAEAGTVDSDQKKYQEGLALVINREIDELTNHYSFEIAATIEKLNSAGNFLGKAEIGLVLDEQELQLKPLRIIHSGGNAEVEYSGKYVDGGGVQTELRMHIEHLEYGGLLRLLDSGSTASGLVYLDASLFAAGPDWSHLASATNGTLDLLTIPDDVEAGILDLWASNVVLALLPVSSGSGKGKKMNCLVARFEVEDGLMESKKILLDSTDVLVHGRGSIDLGQRKLNLLFAPQAKLEKFLSISTPIRVSGPFDDFNVRVAGGGFVMTMFRWYMSLIYVPYKWLTGERFPADGLTTCYHAMDWDPDDIRVEESRPPK